MTGLEDRAMYWTVAEAVAWICARRHERVEALADPATPRAIQAVMTDYAPMGFIPPKNEDGSTAGRGYDFIHPDYVGMLPYQALRDLFEKEGRRGRVRIGGLRGRGDSFEQIPPIELIDLSFRLVPGHPVSPMGLWSRSRGEMAWSQVQVSRDDVMRAWPPRAGRVVKTAAAELAILEHLQRVMPPEAPLTKETAWARCQKEVRGAYKEAFERAWKRLPADRKRARGQHGPRAQ